MPSALAKLIVMTGPRSEIVRRPSQAAITNAMTGTAQIQGSPAQGRNRGGGNPPGRGGPPGSLTGALPPPHPT